MDDDGGELEGVDGGEFLLEVGEVVVGGEGFSGGFLDELLRGEFAAELVEAGAEPFAEGGVDAGAEVGIEGGESASGGGEELGGEDGAEGVGGEVADAAAGPVDVLEDAFAIGGGRDGEVFFHAVIPGGGCVVDGEAVFEEFLFHFEAEDDVEIVGNFVGFDADEGG